MSSSDNKSGGSVRHILSLSGGKDSTALAVYMRDKYPSLDLEYVFADTGEELPETREYLDMLEAYLGRPIIRLNPDRPFSHYLKMYAGMLPDARTRWCTRMLKIRPFEKYVGDDQCVNYIGIRADEADRQGYISTKPNLTAKYPFMEDGINRKHVLQILKDAGLGLPAYYAWRSRSGCYFCFFQRRIEWVNLLENHENLFWKAASFEKIDSKTGERFTWSERESVAELAKPHRIKQIKEEFKQRKKREEERKADLTLRELFEQDGEDENEACLICNL